MSLLNQVFNPKEIKMSKKKIILVAAILIALIAVSAPVSAKPPVGNSKWDLTVDYMVQIANEYRPVTDPDFWTGIVLIPVTAPNPNYIVNSVDVYKDGVIYQDDSPVLQQTDPSVYTFAIGKQGCIKGELITYTFTLNGRGKPLSGSATIGYDCVPGMQSTP